jgi:hypothetical protein
MRPTKHVSPEEFLGRFGICQTDSHSYPFDQTELGKGDGPCPEFDSMSAALMNVAFRSEPAAVQILSGNADRLASSMRRVKRAMRHVKAGPAEISELGGGAGIISLWLAQINPTRSFHVFDHALEPLRIGKTWAAKVGVRNINFHHLSYGEILAGAFPKMDFAFAEHAVELSFPERAGNEEATVEMHDFFRERLHDLAGAIVTLISDSGVSFIGSGIATPWALRVLCAELRNRDLAIDWCRSSNKNGLELIIRPGRCSIFAESHDDALTLLASMGRPRRLKIYEVRPFEALFSDGWEILSVEIQSPANGRTSLRILQKGGYLLKIKRFESGNETADLLPAGRLLAEAKRTIKLKGGESFSQLRLDPRLEITLATR